MPQVVVHITQSGRAVIYADNDITYTFEEGEGVHPAGHTDIGMWMQGGPIVEVVLDDEPPFLAVQRECVRVRMRDDIVSGICVALDAEIDADLRMRFLVRAARALKDPMGPAIAEKIDWPKEIMFPKNPDWSLVPTQGPTVEVFAKVRKLVGA